MNNQKGVSLSALADVANEIAPIKEGSPLILRRPTVKRAKDYIPIPYVLSQHPDFNNTYPPVQGEAKIVTPANLYEKTKIMARHSAAIREGTDLSTEKLDETQRIFNLVELFEPLLTEADIATGISGLTSPTPGRHSDIEEHGISSLSPAQEMIDPSVIRCASRVLREYYMLFMNHGDPKAVSTKIPLFTLPGFPYQGRGGSLVSASFTLALVKIAMQAANKGFSISRLSSQFFSDFGPTKFYEIYRKQSSAKILPETDLGGKLCYTVNLVKRMRAVFPGSKAYLSMLRESVKMLTEGVFLLPSIIRTPIEAETAINSFESLVKSRKGLYLLPLDASKADKRQGRGRAKTISSILSFARGLDPDAFYEELDFPFIQSRGNSIVEIVKGAQLASGISWTTLSNMVNFGLLLNITVLIKILGMSEDEVVRGFSERAKKPGGSDVTNRVFEKNGKVFGMVSFGDDIFSVTNIDKEEIFKIGNQINIELSEEKTLRFLGYDYGAGKYSSFHRGRNLGNVISKRLSPERGKEFPFTAIGHIGQYYALNESIRKEFHILSKPLFREFVGMEWMPISDMENMMTQEWLPQIEKNAAKISLLYDALGSFIHGGMDAATPELLPDSLSMFGEEDLLGKFLFDPTNVDSEIGRLEELYGFDKQVTKILSSIGSNPAGWNKSLLELGKIHNLVWQAGGPIY